MKNLIKKIQNSASLNNLWEKDSKIVVGVSGGPDSVCLLDILVKISRKYEIELHIAHINYGLRGKDSDRDEKIVEESAGKYELSLSVLKVEKLKKENINEENLRNTRYDFFEKVRKELGFDLIAVAHNQDDQVETFFLHLLRGSGLNGLSGMKYKNGKIIRPLLEVSREEILEYLGENKLKYGTDRTNKTNVFFRNKIRNKLIPNLEKNFNPNIKKTIADSMLSIADDLDLISEITNKYSNSNKELKVSEISKLHPALQKRIIIEMIKKRKGDLNNIESAHIDEVIKIIKSVKSKNQKFSFQGLKLTRKGDRLNLVKC
jgi:tRNA(Ile)-lysidine synthase